MQRVRLDRGGVERIGLIELESEGEHIEHFDFGMKKCVLMLAPQMNDPVDIDPRLAIFA